MNKSMYIIGTLLLASLFLTGCDSEVSVAPETPTVAESSETAPNNLELTDDVEYLTYTNEEAGIEIKYPSNYEMQEGFMGTTAIFSTPKESETDEFVENMNVLRQDVSAMDGMDLETYHELNIDQLSKIFTEFELLETKDIEVSGVPAKEVMYTANMGVYKLKYIQIWGIKDQNAFVLTYTGENPDGFERYKKVAQTMFGSLKLIN